MRFCILTHNPSSHFVGRVADSLDRSGHGVSAIRFEDVRLTVQNGNASVEHGPSNIAGTFDACLARPIGERKLATFMFCMNVLSTICGSGTPVVNAPSAYVASASKLGQYALLSEGRVPVPYTVSSLDSAGLLASFPSGMVMIEKPICGSRGVGVRRLQTGHRGIKASRGVVLYQEDLSGRDYDIRAFTVGYKVVAAMKRVSPSLRTNISRGGRPEPIDLDGELVSLAERASRLIGAEVAGVDIILGKDGRPYVLEVNSQPDFIGLETVSKVDIASAISDYMVKLAVRG